MKNIYYCPTQVMFWNDAEEDWCYGIAYGEEIICGCCGGTLEIDEVIEDGLERGVQQPIHEYEDWVDICDAIHGDEFPDSFIIEPVLEIDEEDSENE